MTSWERQSAGEGKAFSATKRPVCTQGIHTHTKMTTVRVTPEQLLEENANLKQLVFKMDEYTKELEVRGCKIGVPALW